MSLFVWGLGLGEPYVLKINSTSPVHSKEPAAGTDKFEQLTEGLSSSWKLRLYHSHPLLFCSPHLAAADPIRAQGSACRKLDLEAR